MRLDREHMIEDMILAHPRPKTALFCQSLRGSNQLGIERTAAPFGADVDGRIRPVASFGDFQNLSNRYDARKHRDLLASLAAGDPAAIPMLVQAVNCLRDGFRHAERTHQGSAAFASNP